MLKMNGSNCVFEDKNAFQFQSCQSVNIAEFDSKCSEAADSLKSRIIFLVIVLF